MECDDRKNVWVYERGRRVNGPLSSSLSSYLQYLAAGLWASDRELFEPPPVSDPLSLQTDRPTLCTGFSSPEVCAL